MKPLATIAHLAEMRSRSRALVFVFVNWAMQARRSDAACNEFLSTLQRNYPCEDIPVYRVDVSEQQGDLWSGFRGWLKDEGQPYDMLSFGGNGAMLWVRLGTVAAYVPYLAEIECHKLMAITRGVFDLDDHSAVAGSRQ